MNAIMDKIKPYFQCWTVFLLSHCVSLLLLGGSETSTDVTITPSLIVLLLLYSCLLLPLVEELLFRKLAFWMFAPLTDRGKLFLSSFLFAIAHQTPQRILPAFCLGVMLGSHYLKHKRLSTCYLLHATTNIVDGVLILLFPVPVLVVMMIWGVFELIRSYATKERTT